ncbi:hypothetical protein GCK72_013418 [Caenorhabditis remanei]|uniref:N-acyl-aliphatic-L-amino acid amidohydrolase n=1 Tax=Caenorhabditis remanei TaxID=31234 RepID=A0A6A5GQU2_CAERE|nr:hypothetical protein GCK72_013418 [Caenorhabditis remanei]KAF1756963.1 hypothetical protein GCK72_013418 [Caenorhabditis remanei]
MENIAVTRLIEYLKINSEQPTPDYVQTSSDWTHHPYSGYKDENGTIYGRGAQDMKSLGIQHMEAFRNLFEQGIKQWKRTIHIVFAPDEETGSENGMKGFVKSEEFKKLNIGFSLDEGGPSQNDIYDVYYGERVTWFVNVTITGSAGHGSKFIKNTALEKLERLLYNTRKFRNEQEALMNKNNLTLADVTTLNVNIINGGVLVNIVPEKIHVSIDIRLTPNQDFGKMRSRLDKWVKDAGEGVSYQFVQYSDFKPVSPSTRDNPFWAAFEDGMKEMNCEFNQGIMAASTDARFVREAGIPALGFTPMVNTPFLLHDKDECLSEKEFLKGIKIYEALINKLANVDG